MSSISASKVKELRDISGAGMMDCKKALLESDGDIQKATFKQSDLVISAKELQEFGLHGKAIGDMQKKMLTFVLQDLSNNSRNLLLNFVNEQLNSSSN